MTQALKIKGNNNPDKTEGTDVVALLCRRETLDTSNGVLDMLRVAEL